MPNKDIIQELSDLGSNLGNISKNIYSVPPGYFEGFSEQLLGFIKASETLSSLPKEMPFNVPAGYFDQLDEKNPGDHPQASRLSDQPRRIGIDLSIAE
jgi:hypothetical protein